MNVQIMVCCVYFKVSKVVWWDILDFQFVLCFRYFGIFLALKHFGLLYKTLGEFFIKTSGHPDHFKPEMLSITFWGVTGVDGLKLSTLKRNNDRLKLKNHWISMVPQHLEKWHLESWHFVKWHLGKWHLGKWHLGKWHLGKWHLGKWHLG